VGAILWIDSPPEQNGGIGSILRHAQDVKWSTATSSLLGTHIWFGNWSFLSVRSWMYEILEYGIVLVCVGLVLAAIRSLRPGPSATISIRPSALFVNALVYGSFLASIVYHVLMNSMNFGVGTSAGWYLYAVVVPEAILITAGLLSLRWGKQLFIALIVCLFALEMYATHWVLLPYYTGLISHAPDGGLRAFHLSQFAHVSLWELLARVEINRPFFLSNPVLITLWLCFLLASVLLVHLSVKAFSSKT
jgi:hypothetical protein